MTHRDTVRDAAGRIVGFASPGEGTQFSQLLAETMTAVGATPAAAPAAEAPGAQRRRLGRFELATVVIGLLIVLATYVVIHRAAPAQTPVATRPAVPTTDHRPPTGAGNQEAIAPVVLPSATPEPPTVTSAPPTATPEVVYIEVAPACDAEVNPAFVAQLPVYDGSTPIGQVTGASCDSQQDAQAKAERAAAALLAALPTITPTATMIVPRPPARPKPLQPPVNQDSGQSPIEIRLVAAGWPIAQVRRVLP